MEKLRNKLWIWGHPTNSLFGVAALKDTSYMSPTEGMTYLGARNMFYVPMGRPFEYEKTAKGLTNADRLSFSLQQAWKDNSEIDALTALTYKADNIYGGIFDDFFNEENTGNNHLNYSEEKLAKIRSKLRTAGRYPLEMWMVAYTKHFGKIDMKPFAKEFDGLSMWFWNESDTDNFDARVEHFLDLAKDKKKLIGLYLYDFGGEKQADPDKVIMQLEKNLNLIKQGLTDGVILHTNAVGDLGYPAVEAAREWIKKYGDDEV